jgi:ferric-dicitrate binding protein FerR (iron transport regulator)
MKPNCKIDRELTDLIERWQIGDLDDESRSRLTERLEADPCARRAFVEASSMEAMLHIEYPDSVLHLPERQVIWFRKPGIWLTAAASIALLAGVVAVLKTPERSVETLVVSTEPASANLSDGSPGTQFIASTPIARVNRTKEIILAPESIPIADGTLVPPGTIKLSSGTLELTFFSGARVTLEGPCELRLKSDFRASLVQGRLTADVPPQATGFTIHTPSGQLRDLGTAFAVAVNQKGDADVHVLDGKVEAFPRGGGSLVTLSGSQASRLSSGKLTPIDFHADGWPVRPDSKDSSKFPKSVHWSLDRFEMDESLDSSGAHPLWMRSTAIADSEASNRLHRGVSGQALSFNGKDQYAESTYRGISGSKPRSVALWVRIPPDASYAYPNGIVSWGTHQLSRKWQVCWNNGDQGTVGALRVEFGDGYLIGTTDLRDGLWHHLTVVFLGGIGSDVASHVKLYVDGRLETLSGRKSQFIRTDTESPQAIALTLGRWLGNWPGKEPFFFNGSLDEIFVFEDALTPAQVAKLALRGMQ